MRRPPDSDIHMAAVLMMLLCASMTGIDSPDTTMKPVEKRPKSTTVLLLSLMKSSWPAQLWQIALGAGARQKTATTINGSQLFHNAHDRMMSRKPVARTVDNVMIFDSGEIWTIVDVCVLVVVSVGDDDNV